MLHNGLSFLIGYWASRWLKLSHYDSKAISIEVGMQNSGLGVLWLLYILQLLQLPLYRVLFLAYGTIFRVLR